MREFKAFICAVLLSVFAFLSPAFAYDFVPVDQAGVLVITHAQLRTPGWEPDKRDAMWETQLLEQKAAQGYSVALLQIADGHDQYFIRNYLVNNQGSFRYVFIIGDARRPENDPSDSMAVPQSNFASGNIVPIWREVFHNPYYWEWTNYQNICESDQGYIDGIPPAHLKNS